MGIGEEMGTSAERGNTLPQPFPYGGLGALVICGLTFAISAHSQLANAEIDYYPLERGNRWTYEMQPKDGGDVMIQTIVVDEVETDGERTRFAIEETDPISAMRTFIERDAKSVRLVARERSGGAVVKLKMRYEPPMTMLKLPLNVGDAWSSEASMRIGPVSSAMRTDCTVDRIERVEVPAGTFECVRITAKRFKNDKPLPDAVAWYAPGIGLVKYVGGEYVRSLVRFDKKENPRPSINADEKETVQRN
jgi:hypothetical protein